MDRRNFLRNGGRLLMLGGMAAGTGWLVSRGQVGKPGSCSIASRCNGCSKLSGCSDDQAVQFRNSPETEQAG
jgi:hypothetical protein